MGLRILFIGDVVGSPGRKIVSQAVPRLIRRWNLGLVVCNAENAAGGSGITADCHEELAEAGVDVFTMGDHVYRKDDIFALYDRTDRLLRPANLPSEAPGPESALVEARDGTVVAVFGLLGRVFMKPIDCPFRAADRVIAGLDAAAKVIVVDFHAEATSEKQLLGRYLDGRVSAVLGTHTHVATADECILPGGTAFQADVGMTGPYESIIGRKIDRVLSTTLTQVPAYLDVATGDPRLCGALIEVDATSGRASAIRRIRLDQTEVRRLLTESAPPGDFDPFAPGSTA
ncbi:MAG: TIGR00282 family metallophosphoesterase [Isosphaeraceae bacterium]